MKPHLTTSASPLISSLRGSVSSVARSHSTPAGSWKAPTRFLPSVVFMPVLPPTAASTIASSVVGQVHDLDAAQPGGGDEAAHVGGRAAADGDDGVAAGEAGLAEHLPAERRDRGELGLLAVRDLDAVRVVPLAGQVRPDRLAGRGQRARVDHRDAPHPVAEHRRAARRAGRCPPPRRTARRRRRAARCGPVMRRSCVHARPASTSRATSSATSSGVRPSVSHGDRGDLAVDRQPLVEQRPDPGAHVAHQQRAA